jgi:hypothetical protein
MRQETHTINEDPTTRAELVLATMSSSTPSSAATSTPASAADLLLSKLSLQLPQVSPPPPPPPPSVLALLLEEQPGLFLYKVLPHLDDWHARLSRWCVAARGRLWLRIGWKRLVSPTDSYSNESFGEDFLLMILPKTLQTPFAKPPTLCPNPNPKTQNPNL